MADLSLHNTLNEYNDMFTSALGHFKDFKVRLMVKPNVQPVSYKTRTLSFVVRNKVRDELALL